MTKGGRIIFSGAVGLASTAGMFLHAVDRAKQDWPAARAGIERCAEFLEAAAGQQFVERPDECAGQVGAFTVRYTLRDGAPTLGMNDTRHYLPNDPQTFADRAIDRYNRDEKMWWLYIGSAGVSGVVAALSLTSLAASGRNRHQPASESAVDFGDFLFGEPALTVPEPAKTV